MSLAISKTRSSTNLLGNSSLVKLREAARSKRGEIEREFRISEFRL